MLSVAVSGINAVDNPGPGLGVIKSIKDKDVKVIGLAYDAMEPGVYMDWLIDRAFLMPYPSEGEELFINRLLYIKQSVGLDVFISTLDTELPILINAQDKLSAAGIKTFLPTRQQYRLRAKDKVGEVAERIGLKIPEYEVIVSPDELSKVAAKFGFPLMIKGVFYKAFKAYTLQEAASYFSKIASEWGYPIIVQKVVSGDEMNVVSVGDGEGGHFGMVAIKKLWITSLGKIWTGTTVKNERLFEATERFVKEYLWKGAFELECIVSGEDVYLVEINPRFPAWVYFATGVGVNLPQRLLHAALGKEPERSWDYEAGKLYVRFTDDFVTDMDVFQKMVVRGER